MSSLAFRETVCRAGAGQGSVRGFKKVFEERRFVVATAALVIAPQAVRHALVRQPVFLRQELENQLHQSDQGDPIGAPNPAVQPPGEP